MKAILTLALLSTLVFSSFSAVETVCIEGLKYIIVESTSGSVSIVQVYEPRGIYPPRPVECNGN